MSEMSALSGSSNSQDSGSELFNLCLGERLIASVSRLLDLGGIHSVLWGNYLLTVYGIPSLSNDAAFVIADDMIPPAQRLLCDAGLNACTDCNCVVVQVTSRPPPVIHFHLAMENQHISLYPLSQTFPNICDIASATDKLIISASDPGLPRPRIGYGKGAFSPEYNSVRVPSPTCFAEACLINFARYARRKDYSQPAYDGHYLSWVAYMMDYAYPTRHLDLNSFKAPFRDFIVNTFLKTNAASFVAAKQKLVAYDC
ncbi:hypothetical protein LOZ66_005603 [Ophidiomyces ophidiicola]|nr:hypothetical protein LOZ65_006522 [Ophidiomyces ophidiicola]KAI1934748.1 hypothetical protein LOZ66_005603 [Ophidiomyces ophidiicola]